MNVEVKDGTKVVYRGSLPGLLLLTGSLVKRDKTRKTQTYRLIVRTWGPPNLLAAMALGGIRHLGQLRVLASRDKAWMDVWHKTNMESVKAAKRTLYHEMVRLVNQYAPLVMQVTPVVQAKATKLGSMTVSPDVIEVRSDTVSTPERGVPESGGGRPKVKQRKRRVARRKKSKS
jgi:hypothetical protein